MPGIDSGWTYLSDSWVPPPAPVLSREEVEFARRDAYQKYSDPLFFGWQRGENTEQEWLDAIQAIKTDNPFPE
jgi:hypothetical protein